MSQSEDLTKAINRLSNLKAYQIYESKWKLVWYRFIMGIAGGFGAIIGATMLIAFIIYVLSQFQWVPFIGDFIAQVIVYLEAALKQ